jgi:hypothetical protein
MGSRGVHIEFLWESQKERDNEEDLDVGERIIVKWILNRMEWYGLD